MRPAELLVPRPEGLYCPPGDFFIDPVRPVARALVTHAHSDHATAGHGAVLATRETLDIMALRLGPEFAGSTQAGGLRRDDRARRRRGRLPSGRPRARLGADRRRGRRPAHRRGGRLQAPARPDLRAVRAGGLRRLHHRGDLRPAGVPPPRPRPRDRSKLLHSLAQFPERTHLVGVYALGKAQRVIRLLRDAGYAAPIYLHGALRRLCDYYASRGIDLGELPDATLARGRARDFAGAVVLGPPSAFAAPWVRRFADPLVAFASGWMQVRVRARQRGVELPLVISDHCDWDELTGDDRRARPGRGLGDPRPRGGAGALVRAAGPARPPAASGRLRGRGGTDARLRRAARAPRLHPRPQRQAAAAHRLPGRRPGPRPRLGRSPRSPATSRSTRVKPAMLRALAAERVDAELFALSYDFVGDLAETIALIWPAPPGPAGRPAARRGRRPAARRLAPRGAAGGRAAARPARRLRPLRAAEACHRRAARRRLGAARQAGAGRLRRPRRRRDRGALARARAALQRRCSPG